MSKLQSMRARMRRISRYARLFFWGFPLLVLFFEPWEKWLRSNYLLSANATTGSYREGLRGFFIVSRKFIVAKPAFRGEDIRIFEIECAAMSYVGAMLHIRLK